MLTLLGLCYLGHIQFLACQLFPELVQNLTIVHVLIQFLHYDTLFSKLIVNPIDKYPLQFNHLRIAYRLRIDYSTLFVLPFSLRKG